MTDAIIELKMTSKRFEMEHKKVIKMHALMINQSFIHSFSQYISITYILSLNPI